MGIRASGAGAEAKCVRAWETRCNLRRRARPAERSSVFLRNLLSSFEKKGGRKGEVKTRRPEHRPHLFALPSTCFLTSRTMGFSCRAAFLLGALLALAATVRSQGLSFLGGFSRLFFSSSWCSCVRGQRLGEEEPRTKWHLFEIPGL